MTTKEVDSVMATHKPYNNSLTFDWYSKESDDVKQSYIIPKELFACLIGGKVFPLMGIRQYSSEEEAMSALKLAAKACRT